MWKRVSPYVLRMIVIIMAIFIIFLALLFTIRLREDRRNANKVYEYHTDKGEAIESFNRQQIGFILSQYLGKSSTLISPLALELTLYNYQNDNGKNDSKLFEVFDNGYQSWDSTKELINDKSIDRIEVDDFSEKQIRMQLRETKLDFADDMNIGNILEGLSKDKHTLIGLCKVVPDLEITGLYTDSQNKDFYYLKNREVSYADTEEYTAIRFDDLDDYVITYIQPKQQEVYLYQGIDFTDTKKCNILISANEYTNSGYANKYYREFCQKHTGEDYSDIQLGFIAQFYYNIVGSESRVEDVKVDITLDTDYVVVVQSKDMNGEVVLIGNIEQID